MIWILALIVFGAGVGMGLRLGAISNAFAFIGILVSMLFVGLTNPIFKALLPHLGIKDPILLWTISPILGFLLVYVLFTAVGFEASRRVNVYYKYKADDLQLALWERLNLRLGACVGAFNGVAWLVLISFFIFNFSYWTLQVADSDNQSRIIRIMNSLGGGLQSTGLDKVARAVGSIPNSFYRTANFAGLLVQNPNLTPRLGNYPAFLSLGQRSDVQQLVQDGSLAQDVKNSAPLGTILNENDFKTVLKNTNLMATVWNIVQTNMNDITNYLITGISPKYDPEKIVGRWSFLVTPSLLNTLEAQPNEHFTASELRQMEAVWNQMFGQTTLIACTDGELFVKNVPDLKSQTAGTETWTGQWSTYGTNYQITIGGHNPGNLIVNTDGVRLSFESPDTPWVFQRIY